MKRNSPFVSTPPTLDSSSSDILSPTNRQYFSKRCKIEHELFSTSIKDIEKMFNGELHFCCERRNSRYSTTASTPPPQQQQQLQQQSASQCNSTSPIKAPALQPQLIQNRPLKFPKPKSYSQTKQYQANISKHTNIPPRQVYVNKETIVEPHNTTKNGICEHSFQYLDYPSLPVEYLFLNYDCINVSLLEEEEEEEGDQVECGKNDPLHQVDAELFFPSQCLDHKVLQLQLQLQLQQPINCDSLHRNTSTHSPTDFFFDVSHRKHGVNNKEHREYNGSNNVDVDYNYYDDYDDYDDDDDDDDNYDANVECTYRYGQSIHEDLLMIDQLIMRN